SPHGGDTHSGGFVRYNPDWTGELMADHGGPKGTMLGIQGTMAKAAAAQSAPAAAPAAATAPATTPTQVAARPSPTAPAASGGAASGDLLAKGKPVYEKTAGGVGCASCHGLDGKGSTTVGAPNIRGKTEAQVRTALGGGVAMMSFIKLTDEEVAAVAAYLKFLNQSEDQ
ncbi:MAG: cytochrome c, partial [Dehalococcoidia bacterium]|nr:cytochrome c [Dehalococcoidia bacterium]